MTLVLIAAALILFLWSLTQVVASLGLALRDRQLTAPLFEDRDLLDLVAKKRAALKALKETELDFETGKVAEDDYHQVYAQASAEAIAVMQALDDVRRALRYCDQVERDLARLEADPHAYRAESVGETPSRGLLVSDLAVAPVTALSPAAAIRERQRTGPTVTQLCDTCGHRLGARSRFCSECGQPLRVGP